MYKTDEQQRYAVQHRELSSHYLVITYNGVYSTKILHHWAMHLKLTQYYKSTIPQN